MRGRVVERGPDGSSDLVAGRVVGIVAVGAEIVTWPSNSLRVCLSWNGHGLSSDRGDGTASGAR